MNDCFVPKTPPFRSDRRIREPRTDQRAPEPHQAKSISVRRANAPPADADAEVPELAGRLEQHQRRRDKTIVEASIRYALEVERSLFWAGVIDP